MPRPLRATPTSFATATPSGGPSDPPFAESLSMDEMPAPPPIDDDALDGWANAEDDYEDDEPPLDWEQG